MGSRNPNVTTLFEHCIYNEMILNFDQTVLGFKAPNRTTFTEKCAQSVLTANVDYKHQITGTCCINISCEFLPVQLIYSGVTERCHPKLKFPGSFHIIHSSTYWSNELILIDYLKKIIFRYLGK